MPNEWNPDQYLKYDSYRTRPARDLLGAIAMETPRVIYDLGCGPGNSTALLARRWPEAKLYGIDSSRTMLERAQASGECPGAHWVQQPIEDFVPDAPADLIFSNAALHWVSDHARLIPRLFSYLKPGGVLAFQVPNNFEAPSHRAVDTLRREAPWADLLRNAEILRSVGTPEGYFSCLLPETDDIDVWQTDYLHSLVGEDAVFEWIRGSTLTPLLPHLSDSQAEQFGAELKLRLRKAYPPLPNPRAEAAPITLFSFKRLFLVARRDA